VILQQFEKTIKQMLIKLANFNLQNNEDTNNHQLPNILH